MDQVREKFQKLYSEERVFSVDNYQQSFDYAQQNVGIENTNQVCLMDRLSFQCFLNKIELNFGTLDSVAVGSSQNNSYLIDQERRDIFQTK